MLFFPWFCQGFDGPPRAAGGGINHSPWSMDFCPYIYKIYIYIYIYKNIYIYIYLDIHVYIYICKYVYIYIYSKGTHM